MKLALVQQEASADTAANREAGLAAVRDAAAAGAQIVSFAELGFEPFYPQRHATAQTLKLAEPIPGETTQAFCSLAAALEIVIVLNLFEVDGDRTYDTSPVIDSDGRLLGSTRMLHITDYPGFHERGYYAPGDHGAPVYDTACGRIGVAICYDRHYPEYMRALALGGADLVVIPQAGAVGEWPGGMFEAEMQVASFQNGYFTALCNRVGDDGSMVFAGESFVCNPAGAVVARAGAEPQTLLCEIDLGEVEQSHGRRLFMRDRRPQLYRDWFASEAPQGKNQ